jgi:putative ABC transport system substrate-binding protein
MRRREFMAAGAAAVLTPRIVRAQRSPVIGYIASTSLAASELQLRGFRQGLGEAGYSEGHGLTIDYRWSDGVYERLPAFAAALVEKRVDVMLASGLPAALAAKAATASIPIVFVIGADPVTSGVVSSLNRPGGNVTGVSQFYGALGGKRLEVLREIVPDARMIAVLTNPKNPNAVSHLNDVQAVAGATGQKIETRTASTEADLDAVFAGFATSRPGALLVADDPFFTVQHKQIVALAARHRVPAIYYTRDFTTAGGLATYGSNTGENYRLGAGYIGRILGGARPGELPVLQPTKFELVINVKTARALGLTIPATLLARADEVIE